MRGRCRQARLTNHLRPAQLVKQNRQLSGPVRSLGSEVCIYPSHLATLANVALHTACLDDTKKGLVSPLHTIVGRYLITQQ